jgi:YihY family inner membrane protein
MADVQAMLRRIDGYQRKHGAAGFVLGVLKKFGDDEGGSLSARITFYAFLSLFPMLLVLVTVLGYVLHGSQDLQRRIVDSALGDFPVIGDQLRHNIGSVRGNGLGLLIGILFTFYGGLGVGHASQDAMNRVWSVPIRVWPGFFPKLLRSIELMGTLALALILTTGLNWLGSAHGATWERVALFMIATLLNVGLFALAFRVLTAQALSFRVVLPGAVISALGWAVLQLVGEAVVNHMLHGMTATYGVFAIVLGLMAWLFILSRIMMYSAEVNVVLARELWPRSLNPPPLTDADRRAFQLYALAQERRPEARLRVQLHDPEAAAVAAETPDGVR